MTLAIRNYERFQHYRDRNPVWIKLYVSLLRDKDFRGLSAQGRLVYMLLLLVAATRSNEIPDDAAWLSVELGLSRKVCRDALAELLAARFLILASDPASNGASHSAPALSAETETETERAFAGSKNNQGLEADRELAVTRLLASLTDKDKRTHTVVRGIITRGKLAVGDIEWARECATGPGVLSPTAVAVAELKKRSVERSVA